MRAGTRIVAGGLGFLLLLQGLAACATTKERMVFDKPGVTKEQRQRDEEQCLRQSITQDTDGSILAFVEIDREVYARCMQTRGYALRPGRV